MGKHCAAEFVGKVPLRADAHGKAVRRSRKASSCCRIFRDKCPIILHLSIALARANSLALPISHILSLPAPRIASQASSILRAGSPAGFVLSAPELPTLAGYKQVLKSYSCMTLGHRYCKIILSSSAHFHSLIYICMSPNCFASCLLNICSRSKNARTQRDSSKCSTNPRGDGPLPSLHSM